MSQSKDHYRNHEYTDRSESAGSEAASKNGRDSSGRLRSSLIGKGLNFASREAYKQLRTNLDFALPDAEGCRAIGITSPMRGDGKSLTAINISYSLAEDGYRTILIEGDLRIPTLSRKLGIDKGKGLTAVLTEGDDFTQYTAAISDNGEGGRFDVLVAGEIPPNPQEMLGSRHMQDFMQHIRTMYDYIILDLPPVTAVADALVASRYLDGMMIIVRNDHTERGALAETVRQLEFSGVHILGFVFNAATDEDAGYSSRYKRRKYRKHSNYGYGSGYGSYSRGYDYGYGYGSYASSSAGGHTAGTGSAAGGDPDDTGAAPAGNK